MPQKIDISYKTVIFIAIFVIALWTIYLIRDLLVILFVSIIFMSALNPLVSFFVKAKLPKVLSIGITYLIIIAVGAAAFAAILQPLIEESRRLILTLPYLS